MTRWIRSKNAGVVALGLLASTAAADPQGFSLDSVVVFGTGGSLPGSAVAVNAQPTVDGLALNGQIGPVSAGDLRAAVGGTSFDIYLSGAINSSVPGNTGVTAAINIAALNSAGVVSVESSFANARAYEPDGSGCYAVFGRYDGPAQAGGQATLNYRTELFPDPDAYGDWSVWIHVNWTGAADGDTLTLILPQGASAFSLAPPPQCPSDFNSDHAVTTADLVRVVSRFGMSVGAFNAGDVNGDGFIDTTDLTALLARFGQSCP